MKSSQQLYEVGAAINPILQQSTKRESSLLSQVGVQALSRLMAPRGSHQAHPTWYGGSFHEGLSHSPLSPMKLGLLNLREINQRPTRPGAPKFFPSEILDEGSRP